jgi:hypothetical protein
VDLCTMARSDFAANVEFWKLRFSKVKDEVNKEVAKMVLQAPSKMEMVEKVMKKRDLDLFGAKTSVRPRNVKQERRKMIL